MNLLCWFFHDWSNFAIGVIMNSGRNYDDVWTRHSDGSHGGWCNSGPPANFAAKRSQGCLCELSYESVRAQPAQYSVDSGN